MTVDSIFHLGVSSQTWKVLQKNYFNFNETEK